MTKADSTAFSWSKQSKYHRLSMLPSVFVQRPSTLKIEALIKDMRLDRKLNAEPSCMIITGRTGVGKTTFLKRYRDNFGPQIRDANNNQVTPVLYISLPSRATPLTTAQEMVKELIGADFAKGGLKALTDLAKKHLIAQRVEVVICDEFQHIVRTAGSIQTYQAAEWIKEVSKDTKIPFVMTGMPEVTSIVETNDQLKSITPYRLNLTYFPYTEKSQKISFRDFLSDYDKALPFDSDSRLGWSTTADAIFSFTGGSLRALNLLVRKAADIAIDSGHDKIELQDLCEAANRLMVGAEHGAEGYAETNPFAALVCDAEQKKDAA